MSNFPTSQNLPQLGSGPLTTGLSGNEIYCLHLKGYSAGNLVVGNSVFALGVLGSLGSGLSALSGGEIEQITSLIHEGRHESYTRLVQEAQKHGGVGVTGVNSELVQHGSNIEFLSIGSCIHKDGAAAESLSFSSSADGQELYCQMDCGFAPKKFAFGNVAYSVGIAGGLMGALRSLRRGEVQEFSQIFSQTRHLALSRIRAEAIASGANAVIGIETTILPMMPGVQEMLMIGTASSHSALPEWAKQKPVTSDLTNQEMWNLTQMGYMPLELVLGVSVYSLGVIGGLFAAFRSLARGEVSGLTTLIYEARENALNQIRRDAERVGADEVVGIKTYVYDLGGGMIEFLAMGTAVKKWDGLKTASSALPVQAIIQDQDTFINSVEGSFSMSLNSKKRR